MSRRRHTFDLDAPNRAEIFHLIGSLTVEQRRGFMDEVLNCLPPMARRRVVIGSEYNWFSPMEQMFDLLSLEREWGLRMDEAVRMLTSYARRNACTSSVA